MLVARSWVMFTRAQPSFIVFAAYAASPIRSFISVSMGELDSKPREFFVRLGCG